MVPVKSDLSFNDMLRAGLRVPLQDQPAGRGVKVHAQRKKKPSVRERLTAYMPPHLIEHELEGGEIVPQRPHDGYIDATRLCQRAGKNFHDYRRLAQTQAFLQELSLETGIPVSNLVQTIKGRGDRIEQGNWVHPQVAINLGQWVSAKFAVMVSKWVSEWMSGNIKSPTPPHLKRFLKNRIKIPHTHFSMLNELYLYLFGPLEEEGIILPDSMMPDISTGRLFSDFLRKEGLNPDEFDTYQHEFIDGRTPRAARMYPIKHLPDFRRYLHEDWLPNRAAGYFKTRLPEALPHLPALLQLPQA